MNIILASTSKTRAALFSAANITVDTMPPRVDETTMLETLIQEKAKHHDIADILADMKAREVAVKNPDAVVIGCDQVLECNDRIFSKAPNIETARDDLNQLRGQTHRLFSAVVIYQKAKPIWRHMGKASLTMRPFSDKWRDDYLARNWQYCQYSVGSYQIEAEGMRLFSKIDGDHFTILGIPMLPVLTYLGDQGFIST
ncbi:MAG: septum formation protein [Paracoccaceae bacterium]|jgi:septum formation protein